jgi:hypothetical protein
MGTRRNTPIGNPFTDAFWKKALNFLDVKREMSEGTAKIVLDSKAPMRCDDYFNKNFRGSVPGAVPRLTVDGQLWMSLTAMEVQASELSIKRANGVVWTAGLGLGYFPLRCARKENVKQVHVAEINEDVVKLFMRMHGKRPEMKKIKIHIGDARKVIKGVKGDYCWMDTYASLASDDVVSDGRYYTKHNTFKEYCFWGWELIMLWLLQFGYIGLLHMPSYLIHYLKTWRSTPLDDEYVMADLIKEPLDEKFCRKCLNSAIHISYT